jgi:hypothetical protein
MMTAVHSSNDDKDKHHSGRRLPWDLKRQILDLRSADWGPIVLQCAQNVWGFGHTMGRTLD